MIRAWTIATSLLLAMTAGPVHAGPPRPSPIVYEIAPQLEGGDLTALVVTLHLAADADGETRIALPDRLMDQKDLWRHVKNVSVAGAASMVEDGPGVRVIRSRPSQPLVVRYRLTSDLDHEPAESDGYPARPWVRPSWFHVDGTAALAIVEGRDDAPARLRWTGWPRDFHLVSNFEDGRALAAGQVGRLFLVGGRDLRVVRAGGVRLAVRGRLGVPDAVLASDLRTIVRAERAFFGEPADAPFLVVAASLKIETGGGFHGSGKREAFSFVATPNLTQDILRPYLAHEIFHAGSPARMGARIGPRDYWFSEGFTDFYARRLLAREDLLAPQAFVDQWNEMLRAYGVSPARGLNGEATADGFWTDPDAEKLPYQRGALLAALWDQRLRARGASLDDVMRDQIHAAARAPRTSPIVLFTQAMAARGLDIAPDIAAHVERGEPLFLKADTFAPCADAIETTTPAFDLGFVPQAGPDGLLTVTRLRPDSPAARAGLTEGMTILAKLKGLNGDVTQPYVLRVRTAGGGERELTFLPRGETMVTYQQLSLRPEAEKLPNLCGFSVRRGRTGR